MCYVFFIFNKAVKLKLEVKLLVKNYEKLEMKMFNFIQFAVTTTFTFI